MSEEKPKRVAIIAGPRMSASLAQLLIQSHKAEVLIHNHHRRLIESGHKWDGMDGYEAPPGFTKEDGDRMWAESVEESKKDD